MDLTKRKCIPCEPNKARPLPQDEIKKYLKSVGGWELRDGHLWRTFTFEEFLPAMDFVNKIAKLAEKEGHHPDFHIHYNIVELEIWTHAVDGLTENDFILAAKTDKLF